MLKLLKHDIKNSYLEIAILSGLLMVLSALLALAIRTTAVTFLTITLIAWVFVFIGVFVVLIKSIITSFHKDLFTNRGYLTLSTPVSLDKILLSKILVNMLWIFAIIISVIVSVLVLTVSISGEVGASLFSWWLEAISENPVETIKGLVLIFFSSLYLITMLALVVTLVNTGGMKKHKFLKGLLVYIVMSLILNLINTPINNLMGKLNVNLQFVLQIAVYLIYGAVFYFIARYLITNKLELE